MAKNIKLREEEFNLAIKKELLTVGQFAEIIGTSGSYLSRVCLSARNGGSCSPKIARRILDGFKGKYKIDDLFLLD